MPITIPDDAWIDIQSWLPSTLVAQLKTLREKGNGYPPNYVDEESWHEELDGLIKAWEDVERLDLTPIHSGRGERWVVDDAMERLRRTFLNLWD